MALVLSPEFVERHLSPDGSIMNETVALIPLSRVVLACAALLMLALWTARRVLIAFFSRYAIYRGRTPRETLSARDLMGTPQLGRLGTALWIALPAWVLAVHVSFVCRIHWPRFLLGERGVFENGTVLCYLLAGVLALIVAFRRRGDGSPPSLHRWWMAMLGAFCILVACEETNWGQVYFRYHTPEMFNQVNYQNEVSLHNIRLPGRIHVRQTYWANTLCLWLGWAGAVGPWLLGAAKRLRRFAWTWEIPIPPLVAQGYFAAGALMPPDIREIMFGWEMRPSEMREFSLAVAFVVWAYSERNRWRIYAGAAPSRQAGPRVSRPFEADDRQRAAAG